MVKFKQNKNTFCSKKCRLLEGGEVLRKFNKTRYGKTFKEIFGEEKATKIKIKQSLGVRKNNLEKGIVPPSRKGIKDSKLTRERKSIGHNGVNTWTKEKFKDKEFREKQLESMLKGLFKRPTSLEKDMMALIQKHNLPYKYVGSGKFWIDGKNPDFVNINGEKKLIEVGNVFHHQGDYIEKRRKHFSKYGWESFIFIGDKLDEEKILKEII